MEVAGGVARLLAESKETGARRIIDSLVRGASAGRRELFRGGRGATAALRLLDYSTSSPRAEIVTVATT